MALVVVTASTVATADSSAEVRAKKPDKTERLFDTSFVHEVEIDVAASDLDELREISPDRVPGTVAVDGLTRELVGVRLKTGFASRRSLDQKTGFSIKFDEFVKGQDVFGIERFSLGNAIYDPSFLSEHLTYEVFRRAGVPAPRTVLADVTFNGEYFGLYVLREVYNKDFLRRYFANPNGNLYEGDVGGGVDLSDPRITARSNEKTNDKSDVEALHEIVATTPDDQYVKALGKAVDLDELFTYWAAEALTAHWDAYLSVTNVPWGNTDPTIVAGNTVPNNYYAYRDPVRGKFVLLPWGADWAMGEGLWLVTFFGGNTDTTYLNPEVRGGALARTITEPKEGATMVVRLATQPGSKERLCRAVRSVLERAWDVPALLARTDELRALVRANGLTASREETSMAYFERESGFRRQFVQERPGAVAAELARVGC